MIYLSHRMWPMQFWICNYSNSQGCIVIASDFFGLAHRLSVTGTHQLSAIIHDLCQWLFMFQGSYEKGTIQPTLIVPSSHEGFNWVCNVTELMQLINQNPKNKKVAEPLSSLCRSGVPKNGVQLLKNAKILRSQKSRQGKGHDD